MFAGIIPANVSYQIPILKLQNNYFQVMLNSSHVPKLSRTIWHIKHAAPPVYVHPARCAVLSIGIYGMHISSKG